MWVNMYRLRVGQRLRELAVLTAVGAALNMGGAKESAPATQAAAGSQPSTQQWLAAPAVNTAPEAAPQALPSPTHAWPRKHRSHAALEARLQKLEQIRQEMMDEAHSDPRACIASSREARAEGTSAAAAATAVRSAAAAGAHVVIIKRTSCDRRPPRMTLSLSSGEREVTVMR
jgi:hypothetical protein